MGKLAIFVLVGIVSVGVGLGASGVFAFFTSQDVSTNAVQVQGSNFDLTVGGAGTLPPLVVSGLFPTASSSQSYPITLNADTALLADLQISVSAVTPPTTAGFSGVLEVTIDVDGLPVYGSPITKTLQDLETESPIILVAGVNGGNTINVTMTVTWPNGSAAIDNLYIGAQFQADITIEAVQVVP